MGLFNFKSNKQAKNSEPPKAEQFDYFGFSISNTDLPKTELEHDCKDIAVKKENDSLNVYLKGKLIGSGDKAALKKFTEQCENHKWNVHSFVVYEGGRAKIRIKYYL